MIKTKKHQKQALVGVRLLDRNDLRDFGLVMSNTHMLRLERAGKFPKRTRISPQKVCWVEAEIQDWLEARLRERHSKTTRGDQTP